LRAGWKFDGDNYWIAWHMKRLKDLELSDFLKGILNECLDTYEMSLEKLDRLEGKILDISNLERYKENTDKLNCLKGITK
jgi:hypothetical protein